MKIISHRGFWKNPNEQNQGKAFRKALESGFGIETDVRDLAGKLVISHNPPKGGETPLEKLFQLYSEGKHNLPLALNIKSAGLQQGLKALLDQYRIENYFVFDMSVPDALTYIKSDMNVFTRLSEVEPVPAFYKKAKGVWIDCLFEDWLDMAAVNTHLSAGKGVCMVSPELAGREHKAFWQYLKTHPSVAEDRMMICTDYPEEARGFFA